MEDQEVDREEKMEKVRANFTEGSAEYDQRIRKIISRYDEMLDALISCVRAQGRSGLRALDIGCGTGAVSELLLRKIPETRLTCLDMTESMLARARQRLEGTGTRFVLADIHKFDIDGPYDVVVSSLALHHVVSDQEKKDIYRKIFDALTPGGVFVNADIVLGSTDAVQEMYMEKWREHMYQSFSRDEVEHVNLHRYRREDNPSKLIDHLQWLERAGFGAVDVVWKYYNFAVYAGWKKSE